MVYLHALSAIHSGTGQSAGVIDLPIAREKATGWPVIPATSVKGVVKDALTGEQSDDWIAKAFGRVDDSGALCFGDQRILCLPVRSFFGTFAYVTCSLALRRLARDSKALGLASPETGQGIPAVGEGQVLVAPSSMLAHEGKVYLEDLDLAARVDDAAGTIAKELGELLGLDDFAARFAIAPDDVFDFLSETATEVAARVRLEEATKTVSSGGLWYEEAVPAEAIFAGPLLLSDSAARAGGESMLAVLDGERLLQIGGKASVGRGLCRMIVTRGRAR